MLDKLYYAIFIAVFALCVVAFVVGKLSVGLFGIAVLLLSVFEFFAKSQKVRITTTILKIAVVSVFIAYTLAR